MQRECNVGHQTEPTGRALLFVSSEAASRVKDWCEKRGVKKTTEGKRHNGTNKNSFDKLLKCRACLFWVLSRVGLGMEVQKHCLLSLPLLLVNSLCYVPPIHLSCTFRPIIAPTWDCTQDNVGIFDNMDCETETLFWINKQHSLELLEGNPRFSFHLLYY